MKLNLKQPKYVLPLLLLPFLCLFFYVYHSHAEKKQPLKKEQAGLNGTVGDVSSTVRKESLSDKLKAYRSIYKEGSGTTAVSAIPREQSSNEAFKDNYSANEKQKLDSIDRAMKLKYGEQPKPTAVSTDDGALARAITAVRHRQTPSLPPLPEKEKDPMEAFKQQMAYMDSL
jgi:hypothetical protein